MSPTKKVKFKDEEDDNDGGHTSNRTNSGGGFDAAESSSSRQFKPRSRTSSASSRETLTGQPNPPKENVPPASPSGPRLVRTHTRSAEPLRITGVVETGLAPFVGLTPRNSQPSFRAAVTQEGPWELPHGLKDSRNYQKQFWAEPKPPPRVVRQRRHDPAKGIVYTTCNSCDPNGGPTDCQHPEDPKYSFELNSVPENDPAFQYWLRATPPPRPKIVTPGTKYLTKVSPTQETSSTETPDLVGQIGRPYFGQALPSLESFAKLNLGTEVEHPDKMLAARHLCNFLTENVEEGVATSYMSVHTTSLPLKPLSLGSIN